MVKLGETNCLENKEIKNTQFKLPVLPDYLPKLQFVCSVIGSTGSGKTTAVINLIEKYMNFKTFDTLVLIAPTAVPDSETGFVSETKFKALPFSEIYDDLTDRVLKKIVQKQRDRIKEYMTFLEDVKLYKRIMKEDILLDDDIIINYYEKYGFNKPTCEYNRIPTMLLVLDDITDTARKPASGDLKYDDFLKIMEMPKEKTDFIMINLNERDKNKRYRLNFNQYITI